MATKKEIMWAVILTVLILTFLSLLEELWN